MQQSNHSSTDMGQPLNSAYQFDEQKGKTNSMENSNPTNTKSVPGQIPPTTQDYSSYAAYQPSMNSYTYPDYQNYYYAYQTPANDPTYQQVGGNQNTGAPYQSLSSFQNASSYMGPTSYSGTYYNPGDYQTTPGYQAAAGYQAPPAYQTPAEYPSSNYSNQTNLWNGGNIGSYPHHEYSSYPALDTNGTPNGAAVNPVHYTQPYNQWDGYYSQNDSSNVLCAPGTEKLSATNNSAVENGNLTVTSGHPHSSNQPPPPGTTSWRQDMNSSGMSMQAKDVTAGSNQSIYWNEPTYQSQDVNQTKSFFQTPSNSSHPSHDPSKDHQKTVYSENSNLSFPLTNPVYQPSQTVSQNATTKDACQATKVQIPTNPKIASNLAISVMRASKENPVTTATAKPAYISVAAPKLSEKVPNHDADENAIKGAIPPSLRAYVERTFARCNDDSQRVANQNIMKEIITSASADGTLLTRDWDSEPIFPLPTAIVDTAERKKSPGRRTKSRWEPLPDEKLVENLPFVSHTTPKQPTWNQFKGSEKVANHLQPATVKYEFNQSGWNKTNFVPAQQQVMLAKNVPCPFKRQRFGDATVTESGNVSSDSDKDQDLTKYYSSASTLANSPDERKKRENRFKRFEKGQEHPSEEKKVVTKNAASRSLYTRRNALFLANNYEESNNRAVEDIDWDSLTVKGTCQEIEKRYLRLTSAPDPTTVRPEDVLEKALGMVQNSTKNYLYKCDQLKSIRQDLTVQRIRNELTVKVYESHARLSLEAGDMSEYNQCQSQLKSLYAEGNKGCHLEFSAYNLLCVIVHSSNKRDLLSSMSRLPVASKDNEAIKHALAVRAAVMSGNYVHFFRLYKKAPNLNTCFMDLYAETMRFEAVNCMCKSYRPAVPILYISHILGFSKDAGDTSAATDGLDECEDWLRAHGAILLADNYGERQLDTKASFSTLFKPDPEDAVAHGDATLAVDDFLTRTS